MEIQSLENMKTLPEKKVWLQNQSFKHSSDDYAQHIHICNKHMCMHTTCPCKITNTFTVILACQIHVHTLNTCLYVKYTIACQIHVHMSKTCQYLSYTCKPCVHQLKYICTCKIHVCICLHVKDMLHVYYMLACQIHVCMHVKYMFTCLTHVGMSNTCLHVQDMYVKYMYMYNTCLHVKQMLACQILVRHVKYLLGMSNTCLNVRYTLASLTHLCMSVHV